MADLSVTTKTGHTYTITGRGSMALAKAQRSVRSSVTSSSTLEFAAPLCGQALAGTGALVFEGEILESPRRSVSYLA